MRKLIKVVDPQTSNEIRERIRICLKKQTEEELFKTMLNLELLLSLSFIQSSLAHHDDFLMEAVFILIEEFGFPPIRFKKYLRIWDNEMFDDIKKRLVLEMVCEE